jgi:glucan biosynthesis protein C
MTSMDIQNSTGTRPKRTHYIDWLRVLAVLLLVPYHTARIFDIWEPFYAKSAQVSEPLTYVLLGAVNPWHMPLFFLLAGAATWFALGFRSSGEYVKERFRRLIIPFLFGLLVIIPPQSYLGALTYGNFDGSFLEYYPQFFQIGPGGGLEGYMGGFTPGHLWFILMLFPLSLIALPLLAYLRGEAGQRLVARLATFFTRPGVIFLLALPLIPTLALPDIGGKNPFYYLTLFVYGYVLMADPRFEEVLDRHKTSALALGLGILVPSLVVLASGADVPEWLETIIVVCIRSFVTWFLLTAILGFGRRVLDFSNRVLAYASKAAYPFYILHQTVVVVIGYTVVQWNISVVLKFLVISVAATVTAILVYEVLIKRIDVVRVLFGMKPRAKRQPALRPVEQKA